MLPPFRSTTGNDGQSTQMRTQKSGAARPNQSRPDTDHAATTTAQIIQIDELRRDVALADIVAHESGIGCLARTRT